MARRQMMKLHEAHEYLQSLIDEEDDEEVNAIFLQPPDAAYDSAEDDAPETEGGNILDLHHNQLHQLVEVEFVRMNLNDDVLYEVGTEPENDEAEMEVEMEVDQDEGEDNRTPSRSGSRASSRAPVPQTPWKYVGPEIEIPPELPKLSDKFKWSKGRFHATQPIFPAPNYLDCSAEAHDLFERFFDNELLQMICDESNEYAVLSVQKNPHITIDELKVFIGIMIVSGYNNNPDKESYWNRDSDLHNAMISLAMSRDRYRMIERFIHFTSKTEIDSNDKMWKLRPLTDKLRANFKKNLHPTQHLSYDESMIKYFGRHGCKQFIKGKPLRFGYKVWCLNQPNGYLIDFEIYQGRNPRINPGFDKYGKCVAPLLQMVHEFPPELRQLSFSFYFDNLFTGVPVLTYLKSLGHNGTGTVRENRLPHNCPLPDNKKVNKGERGNIHSTVMKEENISIVKWKDNKCVCVASTMYGKEPVSKASRFNREKRERILVDRPHSIENYNKYMGGTDRMDQNISYYRIGVRKNKWWWSIFTWLVDVSVQNAWLLQRKSGFHISQLQFRRNIAMHYCNSVAIRVTNTPQVPRQNIPENDRFDDKDHWPVDSTKRRCRALNCNSRTRVKCEKCDVGLCIWPCFKSFHTHRTH